MRIIYIPTYYTNRKIQKKITYIQSLYKKQKKPKNKREKKINRKPDRPPPLVPLSTRAKC